MKNWFEKWKTGFRLFPKKAPVTPQQTPHVGENTTLLPWWGAFHLSEEESRFWDLGQLTLCLERHPKGYHLRHKMGKEEPSPFLSEQIIVEVETASSEIILSPVLPDRFLAVSFTQPLQILPNQEITLEVQIPLCVQVSISINNSTRFLLGERPLTPLLSSWVGSLVGEGQLFYSIFVPPIPPICAVTNESAAAPLASLNNFHALTPIILKNHSKESFSEHSLHIPTPYLSLYVDEQHRLWTDPLQLDQTNHEAGRNPEVVIMKNSPTQAPFKIDLLTPPRQASDTGFRKIGSWLSILQK